MKTSCQICIVGSGLLSKTCALSLAKSGFSVIIIADTDILKKKRHNDNWSSRVYAINHLSHNLLSSINIWQAMDDTRIQIVDGISIRNGKNDFQEKLKFDSYESNLDNLAWIVEDSNLNNALDQALTFYNEIKILKGLPLKINNKLNDSELILENGDVINFSMIIGADGKNSWVRYNSNINFDIKHYNQNAVCGNFLCTKSHMNIARQWFLGQEGILALLPLPDNRISLVWSAPLNLSKNIMSNSLAFLYEKLLIITKGELGDFKIIPSTKLMMFPLSFLRTESLFKNKTVLIGDSAHVIHPLAGQGINLGFADIHFLSKLLNENKYVNNDYDYKILSKYSKLRKEEIFNMQLFTDSLQRIFELEIDPVKKLLDFGFILVNKTSFLKKFFISEAIGKKS